MNSSSRFGVSTKNRSEVLGERIGQFALTIGRLIIVVAAIKYLASA